MVANGFEVFGLDDAAFFEAQRNGHSVCRTAQAQAASGEYVGHLLAAEAVGLGPSGLADPRLTHLTPHAGDVFRLDAVKAHGVVWFMWFHGRMCPSLRGRVMSKVIDENSLKLDVGIMESIQCLAMALEATGNLNREALIHVLEHRLNGRPNDDLTAVALAQLLNFVAPEKKPPQLRLIRGGKPDR